MQNIAKILDLAAETSEDDLCAEVLKVKNRAAAAELAWRQAAEANAPLQNRVDELETQIDALTEIVVEGDLNRYANRFKPEARDKWKAQLVANRSGALELLESLPAPEERPEGAHPPVLNRGSGKTPPPAKDFPTLVREYLAANACSKSQAVDVIMAHHRQAHEEWLAAGGGAL